MLRVRVPGPAGRGLTLSGKAATEGANPRGKFFRRLLPSQPQLQTAHCHITLVRSDHKAKLI